MQSKQSKRSLTLLLGLVGLLILSLTRGKKVITEMITPATSQGGLSNLTEQQRKFVNELYPVIRKVFPERLSQYIISQSALETGWGTSRLYREQNNPWGMMQPATRKTTSTGRGPSGFATYRDLLDAVLDYDYYTQIRIRNTAFDRNPGSPGEFVRNLHARGYFTAPINDYQNAVTQIHNKIFG
jgi:flagellum-specific peptidoglycan hydrolase FlgJ